MPTPLCGFSYRVWNCYAQTCYQSKLTFQQQDQERKKHAPEGKMNCFLIFPDKNLFTREPVICIWSLKKRKQYLKSKVNALFTWKRLMSLGFPAFFKQF